MLPCCFSKTLHTRPNTSDPDSSLRTLTSSLLEPAALRLLLRLGLRVFTRHWDRLGLRLLVLFALAAVVAALRLPVRTLSPLLLLALLSRRRLLPVVVEHILLLLNEDKCFSFYSLHYSFKCLFVFEYHVCPGQLYPFIYYSCKPFPSQPLLLRNLQSAPIDVLLFSRRSNKNQTNFTSLPLMFY